ncbi:MAG TPA: CoA-binding protein [Candidatus Lokiarchaeia archaeon]
MYKEHFLYKILNPRSICVFGANNDLLMTMGSMQLRNIVAGGFMDNIYPIHPKLERVQGFKAYKSVLDLPEIPELAFIILPPRVVPDVMEECGQKGIKGLIITSGGFRESGPDGVKLSEKVNGIAKKYGIRFIGPNCLGVYNGWIQPEKENTYFNTMWIYYVPKRGNATMISQSGTIACHTFWHANNIGVKIGQSISIGNETNIDIVDYLDYYKNDPYTGVIGLYIEEIKRGKEFIKLAKEITPIKPIVAIYAGGSEAAERSIMSHTGSIGGNEKIYDAVFKETGIISTDLIYEFLYYLRTLSHSMTYNIFPKGNRVGIITDSGGSGSMMTKAAELYGLKVPEFSPELQAQIRDLIPPTAGARNPIDVTFDVNFYKLLFKFPKILMSSGEIDGILVYGVFDFEEVFSIMKDSGYPVPDELINMSNSMDKAILRPILRLMKKYNVPVFYVGPQPYKYPWYQKFLEGDVPIFDFWDMPTKCMSILVNYAEFRRKYSEKY